MMKAVQQLLLLLGCVCRSSSWSAITCDVVCTPLVVGSTHWRDGCVGLFGAGGDLRQQSARRVDRPAVGSGAACIYGIAVSGLDM